jgi:hypothetical protein
MIRMTQNLTGSQFVVRFNGRKHLNSPLLGYSIHGGVCFHDGQKTIFDALRQVVALAEAEASKLASTEDISIVFITKPC